MFEAELHALSHRMQVGPATRWRTARRSAAARTLALALVARAAEAGDPPPAGAVPPEVAPHGLGDQVRVLGDDLLAADPPPAVLAAALADLRLAAALLLA